MKIQITMSERVHDLMTLCLYLCCASGVVATGLHVYSLLTVGHAVYSLTYVAAAAACFVSLLVHTGLSLLGDVEHEAE